MVEASETSARRLLAALVVLSFVGCEDDPPPTAAMAGASSGGKPPVELVCPATVPGNGVACNATLFCTYPVQVCPSQSANTTASCVNGRWLVSAAVRPICQTPNLPMPLPCPTLPPSTGEPCPSPGVSTTSSCSYATTECPSVVAYCQVGQWLVIGCDGTGGGGGTGAGGTAGASGAGALAGVAGQPDGGQAALGGAAGSPD